MDGPLGGQRLRQVLDGSLGGVVSALRLGPVDNGSGHGGDEHHGSAGALLDHVSGGGLGHQEGSVKVDVDDSSELVCGVLSCVNKVSNTGGVDHNVDGPEIVHNSVDDLVDGLLVSDVGLVELGLHSVGLVQLLNGIQTQVLLHIQNGNALEADRTQTLGHGESESSSSTSHNGYLAIESELGQKVLSLENGLFLGSGVGSGDIFGGGGGGTTAALAELDMIDFVCVVVYVYKRELS